MSVQIIPYRQLIRIGIHNETTHQLDSPCKFFAAVTPLTSNHLSPVILSNCYHEHGIYRTAEESTGIFSYNCGDLKVVTVYGLSGYQNALGIGIVPSNTSFNPQMFFSEVIYGDWTKSPIAMKSVSFAAGPFLVASVVFGTLKVQATLTIGSEYEVKVIVRNVF